MILHVYLARRFLRLFFGVFAVLALFQFLIELMEELRRAPESLAFADVLLLTALALLEHAFMVLRLPDEKLWRWMLPAPRDAIKKTTREDAHGL